MLCEHSEENAVYARRNEFCVVLQHIDMNVEQLCHGTVDIMLCLCLLLRMLMQQHLATDRR